jgi:hypothetical protein
LAGGVPGVVAGEVDVLPAEWGEVFVERVVGGMVGAGENVVGADSVPDHDHGVDRPGSDTGIQMA